MGILERCQIYFAFQATYKMKGDNF
ncbi:protein of unknown function [Rhodovastum atsumiense]|nr:protein of unknown function [Rhodovastum atsumiense]